VHDGILTSAESPVVLNLAIRHIENLDEAGGIAIDLVGEEQNDGSTTWDYSAIPTDGVQVEIEALPLADFWFADSFPSDAYVVALDGREENYGIYRRTETTVELLGLASAEVDSTLLTYANDETSAPVELIRYPLALGDTWESVVDTSGTFEGNYFASTDTHTITVDAEGTVLTPAGPYEVLRLQIVTEVDIPIIIYPFLLTYRYVKYAYMTPCLGQVVYVASEEDEPDLVFDTATLVRTVGLLPQ